jgi:hypothetical protein
MDAHRIFFSHKHQDEPVTREIISLIHRHTENVKCFISEDIEKGTNWRKAIAEHLTLSSFLVLVFADPEEDWGWCLYETGFFDALSQLPGGTQLRRIYCLHNPSTTPPSPISDLQTVPATAKDVSQWLGEIFVGTKQSKKEFHDDIPNVSDKICDLFLAGRKAVYLAKSINLNLKRSLLKSSDDLPDDTVIQGDSGLIDELFGTNSGRIDWKFVKRRFNQFPSTSEINLRALKEVSRAAYCICNDNRVLPLQGMIFAGQGPKRYRPVISHAKEISAGTINLEILLVEEVGGPLQNVDKDLGALLTALRMALRIRWEIVRPFTSKVSTLSRLDPRKLRFDLQTCLNNIFSEAEFRGTYSPADIWTAFENQQDKDKMLKMINESHDTFRKFWQSIGFNNPMETFGEVSDKPFANEDEILLDTGLAELRQMNEDFLNMAALRLQALIRREVGSTKTGLKTASTTAKAVRRNRAASRGRPTSRSAGSLPGSSGEGAARSS